MVEIKELHYKPDILKPKRIQRYVLVWCSAGNMEVVVDDREFNLSSGQVITITSGQVHYIKDVSTANGKVLEFTLAFFCKDDEDIELIFHNGLFCHFAMNEVISVDNFEMVEEHLRLITEELTIQPFQYLASVRSRIELILIEINRTKILAGHEIYKPDALFLKFLELVRDNFKYNYTLSQFAAMLHTTELKLNEQANLHSGRTAQNVIYGLIVSEAKRLLSYQNLSVKEIAFELGFNDPFYFSNFFKKHTRQSPKAYKAQQLA